MPQFYNAAYNAYGKRSYVSLDGSICDVEQGASQGCPLANSFFNLGVAILIDKLSTFKELTQIWFADDGLIYGRPEELKKVWSYINLNGKEIGYFPNSKSVIYDCSINS